MSVNGYPRMPQNPVMLLQQDAWGRQAPDGHGFDPSTGQLVPLAYPAHGNTDPNLAWDFNNPLYRALYKGEVTIENQPGQPSGSVPGNYGRQLDFQRPQAKTHENVALVPKSEYLGQDGDDVPVNDLGTTGTAFFDQPATMARTEYRLSRSLMGLAQMSTPLSPTSPLMVAPSGSITVPPFGGAVAAAQFQWGHAGTQASFYCDVLPGAVTKAQTAASFGRVQGRILPAFWKNSDDVGTHTRTYLLFPGGPTLTNDMFSNPPLNIIQLQGNGNGTIQNPNAFGAGVPSDGKVVFSGWFSSGQSPVPSINCLPTRTFQGTVLSDVALANVWASRIPVPAGAIAVIMVGGWNSRQTTPASIAITWNQNTLAPSPYGPFPANTNIPVPLIPGCQSIDVLCGVGPAAGGVEVPFSATFFLNV